MDKQSTGLVCGLGGLVPVLLKIGRPERLAASVVEVAATAKTATVVVRNTGDLTSGFEVDVVIASSASGSGCDISNGMVYHTCIKQGITLAPSETGNVQCTFSLEPGTYYAIAFIYQADGPCLDGSYLQFEVETPPPPPPQTLFESGFESGDLSEWDALFKDHCVAYTFDTPDEPRTGEYMLYVDFYNCYPNSELFKLSQYVLTPAIPGETIKLSGYVRPYLAGIFYLEILFYQGLNIIGAAGKPIDAYGMSPHVWAEISVSGVVPPGCDNIGLNWEVKGWDGNTDIDDIKLEYV